MRTLLRVRANEEERGVVLGRPELEGGRVLEGTNSVGLGKCDGVGLLELVLSRVSAAAGTDTRTSSERAVLTFSEMDELRTKMADLTFSLICGMRFSAARFERAFALAAGAMMGVDMADEENEK